MADRRDDGPRPGPTFPSLRREAAPTQAIALIREMILKGDLGPRQVLPPERDLALRLGVSRPTLREAIQALTAMNILERRQGDGTYVTTLEPALLAEPFDFVLSLTESSIRAVYEARRIVEGELTALAATRATDGELEEFDRLLEGAEAALEDPGRFLDLDFGLHAELAHASHNPILVTLSASLGRLSMETRQRSAVARDVRVDSLEHHRSIVSALHDRDPDRARLAMLRHLAV